MGIGTAIVGSVAGPLINGIFGNDAAKDANKRQWRRQLIAWGHEDDVRRDERRYLEGQTKSNRAHARQVLADNRRHERATTLENRSHARQVLNEQRGYNERMGAEDRAFMLRDRAKMQAEMDERAERTTASRGIDFGKLRDEAIAAGFNPLSVLGNAALYSTEVGYGTAGGPYQAGPTSIASGSAVSGGSVPGGAVMAGSAGSGYSAGVMPEVITSGNFMGEALSAGVNTAFNALDDMQRGDRELTEALARATSIEAQQKAIQARNPGYQGFAVATNAPFNAAESYTPPALYRGTTSMGAAISDPGPTRYHEGGPPVPHSRGLIPVVDANGIKTMMPRGVVENITGSGEPWQHLVTGNQSDLYGEVGGEAYGIANSDAVRDTVRPRRDEEDSIWETKSDLQKLMWSPHNYIKEALPNPPGYVDTWDNGMTGVDLKARTGRGWNGGVFQY